MIILASASPRRKEILSMITDDFKIVVPEFDETIPDGLSVTEAVMYLSKEKAKEIYEKQKDDMIIAADTIVELDGVIFGKPLDFEDSVRQLSALSGKIHNVHTGVTVMFKDEINTFCSSSNVTFDELSLEEIHEYINTGEPMDKAGSYAIQGIGAKYIKSLNGDFYAVMGLPLNELYRLITNWEIFC